MKAVIQPKSDGSRVVLIFADVAVHRPPAWEDAPAPILDWNLFGKPEPDSEFGQRIAW
jgi:hypothetical protein